MLSPLAWTLGYRYPVHRIGPDYRPVEEEPTFLVVYRDRDDEVGFLVLNPVTARLLEGLRETPTLTGRDLLAGIAAEIGHADPQIVIDGGQAVLEDLRRRGVILGADPRPATSE